MRIFLIILVLFIIFEIPTCIGMGLIFKKKKLNFKKGIIPFYNKIILINYYKLPQYHLILIFIPIVSIYTNYLIYSKMCKEHNKEFLYILELTFFPFIYNIFLGLELKEKGNYTQVDNYFEDQKNLYETRGEKQEKIEDEYVWYPKKINKSNTVYKASRNKLNARVNINLEKNNNIIDNKKKKTKINENNTKICPNCGAKISDDTKVCYICGTKL